MSASTSLPTASSVASFVTLPVMRDGRQAIDAFDGARTACDAEVRHRRQRHARAGGKIDREFGQVVDGLTVGFAEGEAQRQFAFGAAEFAQSIAAHAGGHGLRDVGGGEAERGGALPIDHDLHFLVALARFGSHRLESLHARHHARDFVAEHREFLGGLARELHAEALSAHGVGVVPFEAGFADDDFRQSVLRLGDEFLRLESAVLAGFQHSDGKRTGLVVHGIEALDAELFAPRFEMPLDGFRPPLRRDRWDAIP